MTVKEAPYYKYLKTKLLLLKKFEKKYKMHYFVQKREKYQVDDVHYDDEFDTYIKGKNPEEIHVYHGVDPDS